MGKLIASRDIKTLLSEIPEIMLTNQKDNQKFV